MDVEIFKDGLFYCPIDGKYHPASEYLQTAIADEKVRWIANLVTWYRHNAITSWNKCWGHGGGHYRSKWFKEYEEEKSKVNERAKRQLIRKCYPLFRHLGVTVKHFAELQNTANETIAEANKYLDDKIEVVITKPEKKKQMQKELTDTDLMPWGKHQGVKMINVPADYLIWIYENDKCNAPVKKYIETNMDVLRSESKKLKQHLAK